MSDASEDRLAGLMLTLDMCGLWDKSKVEGFIRQVIEQESADERQRCLLLAQQTQRRLMQAKGKSWLNETDQLIREIANGQSLMEGAGEFTILTPNQKS